MTPEHADRRSLPTRRAALGKGFGFLTGVIIALLLPVSEPELGLAYKFAFVFWLTLAGALIALTGIYARHPIAGISTPWWLRGAGIGGFMLLTLALANPPAAVAITGAWLSLWSAWIAAIILTLFGALFGLVTEFLCTRFAGEGDAVV